MDRPSVNYKTAIIINPRQGGGGDKALGRKVDAYFKDKGYITKLFSIDVVMDVVMELGYFEIFFCVNIQKSIIEYTIKKARDFIKNDADKTTAFNNSLIVISPLSKTEFFYIPTIIDELQQHYKFKRDNLLIIDELGSSFAEPILTSNNKFPYEEFKEQLGFNSITDRSLGFDSSKQQIGYFPLDTTKLELIDKSYKYNLKLLFDSFNLDYAINDMLLFGYISSEFPYHREPMLSIYTLIDNSLIELESLDKYKNATSINYVLLFSCWGILDQCKNIVNYFTGKQKEKYSIEENNIDFYFCNDSDYIVTEKKNKSNDGYEWHVDDDQEDKTRIMLFHQHRPNIKNAPLINIFMINGTIKLPLDTFLHFIKLSDMGIMTGDQSLFEYMSIKKELPYYYMQYWKTRFVHNLLDQAQKSNIDSLQKYYAAKFLGIKEKIKSKTKSKTKLNTIDMSVSLGIPKYNYFFFSRDKKDIRDDAIKKLTEINQQKQEFEAKLLAQDVKLFINEYLENYEYARFWLEQLFHNTPSR